MNELQRGIWTLAISSLAGFVAAQNNAELSYRVAGTVAIDANRAVAMIESSAGTQQIYRIGEQIEGWDIVTIDQDEVELQRNGRTVRLPLQGKLTRLDDVAVVAALAVEDIETGTIDISYSATFDRLQALEERASAGEIVLTRRDVNRALKLSDDTQIHRVNGEAVASPMAIVQLAMVSLAKGYPTRLGLSEDFSKMLYLMPTEDDDR